MLFLEPRGRTAPGAAARVRVTTEFCRGLWAVYLFCRTFEPRVPRLRGRWGGSLGLGLGHPCRETTCLLCGRLPLWDVQPLLERWRRTSPAALCCFLVHPGELSWATSPCISVWTASERSEEPGQRGEVCGNGGGRRGSGHGWHHFSRKVSRPCSALWGHGMVSLCLSVQGDLSQWALVGVCGDSVSFPLGTSWRPLLLALGLHNQQDCSHPRVWWSHLGPR